MARLALSWAILLGISFGLVSGLRESVAQGWWQSGLVRLALEVLRERVYAALAIALGLAVALLLVAAIAAWAAPRLAASTQARALQRVLRARVIAVLAGGAALGLLGLEAGVQVERRDRPAGPNLLLITVDTLRADHLGCYGYPRPTSPHIDELASRGVLFRRALSQAPWTLPSMASALTSLYPSQHGAQSAERRLPADVDTLAERLRNAGYHTLAITSHAFVSPLYGLDQGFARFETQLEQHDEVSSARLTRGALALLGARPREPFFLWVHYFDPHLSYLPHPEHDFSKGYSGSLRPPIRWAELEKLEAAGKDASAADLAFVASLYDEEIAYTDEQIGALLEGIERIGLGRSTLTVLTADHGDCLGERGRFGHGRDVFPELVQVPLIIAGAPQAAKGSRVEAPVETRNIAATLLALAGVSAPGFPGENLLALADGSAAERLLFVEGSSAWSQDDPKLAVLSGDGWKLVQHRDGGRRELYQTTRDPEERVDLAASDDPAVRAVRERLEKAADEFRARGARSGASLALDPADHQRLRELGYVE